MDDGGISIKTTLALERELILGGMDIAKPGEITRGRFFFLIASACFVKLKICILTLLHFNVEGDLFLADIMGKRKHRSLAGVPGLQSAWGISLTGV